MKIPDKLNEIILSITNRCNLRCAMCQIPGRGADEEMTTCEVKALILDAAALFPNAIVFSGGEPLLRDDLFELIAFAGLHHMNTCLTSNGVLIDDALAGRLAASGMGVVNISIEGPEEVDDLLRGNGHFQKATRALAHLARHRVETTIATTVCRQNYRFLPDVIRLAGLAGVTTVKFQPFSPIFLMDKEKGVDFFLPRASRRECEAMIEEVLALASAQKIATNPAAYLRALPAYLCGEKPSAAPAHCAALWTSCPISAGGDVHPCWIFADKVLGNVKKGRLSKIWNSGRHERLRRHLLARECSGCFMSCYDANLGPSGWAASIALKAGKLKKPKFYRRAYFKFYQYARYLVEKVLRRIRGARLFGKRRLPSDVGLERAAVRSAREVLRKKIKEIA